MSYIFSTRSVLLLWVSSLGVFLKSVLLAFPGNHFGQQRERLILIGEISPLEMWRPSRRPLQVLVRKMTSSLSKKEVARMVLLFSRYVMSGCYVTP